MEMKPIKMWLRLQANHHSKDFPDRNTKKGMNIVVSNLHYKWVLQQRFAATLLTILLWAASLGRVWSQGVIGQSSTIGDNLDALFNLPTNTVTIISGVTIENSTSGGNAVSGSSRTWYLTNAATLNGNTTGVYLGAGGTVNNQSEGSIVGGSDGMDIYYGSLAVDNAGLISGNSLGISVNESGIITNESSGIITGGTDGINGFGGPQTIFNAGTIIGTNNTAILYGHGGNVINLSGGTIEGYSGIFLNGGFCYVTNSGSVMGEYTGVNLFSGGDLENLTNGIVAGGNYGVSVNDSAFVNNAGVIVSTNNVGVQLNNGDSLINQSGGMILGGTIGVEIDGGSGTLTNAGTIIGQSGTAIGLGGFDSVVTLQTGSDIQGDISGGGDGNMACLQGNGCYSNDFVYFGSLTVQADATGWNLTGSNTFSTATEVQSGSLFINGVLATPVLTVDPSGTLGGGGMVNGSAIIESGSTIAPGTTANLATLTFSGNVALQGTTLMKLTSVNANSDQLDASSLTYGGTLTVTNLSATSPTNGESYQLFSAASSSGALNVFNLPPLGAGLAWNWNSSNGTLSVVSGVTSPPEILSPRYSATNFTFSFATASGLDYTIWGNTNLDTSDWTAITNFTGDGLTDEVNVLVSPGSPAGFFRVTTSEDIISP